MIVIVEGNPNPETFSEHAYQFIIPREPTCNVTFLCKGFSDFRFQIVTLTRLSSSREKNKSNRSK